MFDDAVMLFLFAESPLHPGSGSSATAIDLPIQRESHTSFPQNHSTGLKGALRDACRPLTVTEFAKLQKLRRRKESARVGDGEFAERIRLEEQALPWEIIFGPDTDRADDHAGCIAPSDARLLLFPVRSVQGVFAWITCPLALARFHRDLCRMKIAEAPEDALRALLSCDPVADECCLTTNPCDVSLQALGAGTDRREVVLEDFCLRAVDGQVENLNRLAIWLSRNCLHESDDYFRMRMSRSLVVVSDTVFRDFAQNSTEVATRNKIDDETGVVANGAIWNVENLPSETLLYSIIPAMRPASIERPMSRWEFQEERRPRVDLPDSRSVVTKLQTWLEEKVQYMQLGGDQTVGRGFVSVRYLPRRENAITDASPNENPGDVLSGDESQAGDNQS